MNKGSDEKAELFIDVNIFIDVLEKRSNWQSSFALLNAVRDHKISGCVSSLTVAIIYFLRRQSLSDKQARKDVRDSIEGFKVVDVSQNDTLEALSDERFSDFEDALQFYYARDKSRTIITRNKRDFARITDKIGVLSPEEFLKQFGQDS